MVKEKFKEFADGTKRKSKILADKFCTCTFVL